MTGQSRASGAAPVRRRLRAPEPTRLAVLGHDSCWQGDTEMHRLALRVPADLHWLRGHFDDYPVLPAIVQLWEVHQHVRAIWPELAAPRRITRAKFCRPVRPEDLLQLRLQRAAAGCQAGFEFRRGDEICSSGVMTFQPPEGDADE